ncbi:hypothetical protein HK098_008190 [Nowakowskiella sp. JEL0407]|nr:hypothetical protein HK098_008190 [Nowakowskiella sp. JEL0407]
MTSFPPTPIFGKHHYAHRNTTPQQSLLAVPSKSTRSTKKTEKLIVFPDQIVQENIQGLNVEEFEQLYLPDEAITEAEEMEKNERWNLPRVTAYCVAQGFNLNKIQEHIDSQDLVSKTYDDCLYISYDHNVSYINMEDGFNRKLLSTRLLNRENQSGTNDIFADNSFLESPIAPEYNPKRKWMTSKEVFIFDYGVIVFWNFSTAEYESRYLEKIEEYAVGMIEKSDIETEELWFQYDLEGDHPRIFNDLITLTSGNPLIKLTLSHGLAQSVKMGWFEELMELTIQRTIPLPRELSATGEVKLPRKEIMKTVGSLYRLRMNINLVSDVLDSPEIFWYESEMDSLYSAIREYLEIDQRVTILNKKLSVISDLLEMLSDHVNSNQMNVITWIIIFLILVAVGIAFLEVYVKFLRWNVNKPEILK